MTDYTSVISSREGPLGRIILNRPDARNPLDNVSAVEILHALDEHSADPDVRAIAISGAGDAFCAGGDLRQMSRFRDQDAESAMNWPRPIIDVHLRMLDCPKPVIAAVDGPAYAGGMGLAGMCDVIVATRRSRFAMPEVRMGLFPMIIVAHLARSIPRKHLLEMMFTGEPIGAEEAWRLGFVNRVVDDLQALEEMVTEYGSRFSKVSPSAVRIGRRAFALMADLPARQALEAAQFFNLPMFLGDDLQEGTAAFFDRRSPAWSDSPPQPS